MACVETTAFLTCIAIQYINVVIICYDLTVFQLIFMHTNVANLE